LLIFFCFSQSYIHISEALHLFVYELVIFCDFKIVDKHTVAIAVWYCWWNLYFNCCICKMLWTRFFRISCYSKSTEFIIDNLVHMYIYI